jgi:hypothetical protein
MLATKLVILQATIINPFNPITRIINGDYRDYRKDTGDGMDYTLFTDTKEFNLPKPQKYLIRKGSDKLIPLRKISK